MLKTAGLEREKMLESPSKAWKAPMDDKASGKQLRFSTPDGKSRRGRDAGMMAVFHNVDMVITIVC